MEIYGKNLPEHRLTNQELKACAYDERAECDSQDPRLTELLREQIWPDSPPSPEASLSPADWATVRQIQAEARIEAEDPTGWAAKR
jgi:hypothetical protein